MPGVVGAHIDRIASNHGTAKRLVSQLDAPDDVPPGGRIPVNRRIARLGGLTEGLRPRTHRPARSRGPAPAPLAGLTRCRSFAPLTRWLPAIRLNAHSASSRSAGSFAAALSASGPTVPSVRCFPALRPRRCAHRGIHPPELRSTAARRTARPGRCLRGPHTPPIERRESDRPGLWPGPWSPRPPSDRWTPGPPPRRCGRMDPRARES